MNRPNIKKDIDLSRLIEVAENFMDEVDIREVSEDTEHYIFEKAMVALYGEDVWTYVNEKIN